MQYYGTRLSENISKREPQGYLLCLNVPVARTGTQEYLPEELGLISGVILSEAGGGVEGSPRRGGVSPGLIPVYRPEEEVFSPETMASFEGMPVTNDHPPEGVNVSNIRALQKGHAHNVRRGSGEESDLLLADLIITDPDLIDAILVDGKREISCGYALSGKIDLIVTKSVSRFARNTVDSLTTIRELKEHGTEVYFEKENIWTFDSKGELLLTIMSSLAQEESRSISENVRWGQRKRAADGKYSLAYSHFLGYDKGPDGRPMVNPEQAVIVRRIFSLFLQGYSFNRIAGILTEEGIPSPAKKTQWNDGTIKRILMNEIYMGDRLLQKTFTLDFLHKTPIKNEGQVPQYYVENDHEAIIPPETFQRVQDEIKRREGGAPHGISIFSGKLYCGSCGHPYGPKLWHSKDEYRRTVWQCNAKYKKKLHCRTPHLTEDEIKDAFLRACCELAQEKDETITCLREDLKDLENTAALKKEADRLMDDCSAIAEKLQQLIDQNARVAQDQNAYLAQYEKLADSYKRTDKKLKSINEEIRMKEINGRRIREFINEFEQMPSEVTEFNDGQWATFVDRVTIYGKDDIRFTLTSGAEVRA